jgi:hypothetical protein
MKLVGVRLFALYGASIVLPIFAQHAFGQEGSSSAGRSAQTEGSLAPGSAILAELNSSVDSKKAKAGDPITAHTSETLKSTDDRTIIPKGTKIEGHVTQAVSKGKDGEESALGIQFDKALLKDGGEIPLNVVIQAVAAPTSFSAPSDLGTPPTVGTTQTSPMSGNRTGPPPNQSPQATAPPDMGSGASVSPQLDAKSRGVIGLRGLTLNNAPVDNRSASVLVSTGKSVHLDGGTRMLLVVQAQGAEPSGQ